MKTIVVGKGRYLSDYLGVPARGEHWLLSADTGIGKTYWALALYIRHSQKTLVVTSLTGIVEQGGKLRHVDFWYEGRNTYDKVERSWDRGGHTIICTYDSAEKVAALIDLENYIVIFDESHNIAFSAYRANAINAALAVAARGKAIVAMSGTIRPIAHPTMANSQLIVATREREPINAVFVQAAGRDSFIRKALARVDLNGRNVLFFNKKGVALEKLVASISHLYPMLNIVCFNADTKTEEGIRKILHTTEIKRGTLLICTAVMIEGINIQEIDNLIVAMPLHIELLHQLASRAREHLGNVLALMPQSWVVNEEKDTVDIEQVYHNAVSSLTRKANGIIEYRAFLENVSTRDLFEYNGIVPKLTRHGKEGKSEEIDYVIIDCIAHALRAKEMSQSAALAILSGFHWQVTIESWEDMRIERMKKTENKNQETWERIKDMSYDDLSDLAQKYWVVDSKLAKVYVAFLEGLADSEELLYESWLLNLGRRLFDPSKPTEARRVLGIIDHARNGHAIYERIFSEIEYRKWDKQELGRFVADCGRGTLIQNEIDRLSTFNPNNDSECRRVLGIIKRYLDIARKKERVSGGGLVWEWEVKRLAIMALDIPIPILAKLIEERNGLISRRDKKILQSTRPIVLEPLKTFMEVVYNGVAQSAEQIERNNERGIALCDIGGGVNKFFSLDTDTGLWYEFGKERPIAALPTQSTPFAEPTIAEPDTWLADLIRRYGNCEYD